MVEGIFGGYGCLRDGHPATSSKLASEDGRWLTVENVRDTGEFIAVYNLRVSSEHTYFVGEATWGFAVWSHNAGCVPNAGPVAEPNGSFYSTAFESNLNPSSYLGASRGRHFQEANESLLRAMESDGRLAQSLRDLGVSLERTPSGLAPRQPPPGWTWHHAQEPGVMQLVPRTQHTPGSIFWDTLHPGGRGGFAIWGQ